MLTHCLTKREREREAYLQVACLFSYAMLNSKVIALEEQATWSSFVAERVDAIRQCALF